MAIKALISGTLLFLSSVITTAAFAAADYKTDGFSFVSDGNVLDGIISRPVAGDAASILILVHSYGPTNVVAGDRHKDIRSRFAAKGISVVVWDKPGCGNSEVRLISTNRSKAAPSRLLRPLLRSKHLASPDQSKLA